MKLPWCLGRRGRLSRARFCRCSPLALSAWRSARCRARCSRRTWPFSISAARAGRGATAWCRAWGSRRTGASSLRGQSRARSRPGQVEGAKERADPSPSPWIKVGRGHPMPFFRVPALPPSQRCLLVFSPCKSDPRLGSNLVFGPRLFYKPLEAAPPRGSGLAPPASKPRRVLSHASPKPRSRSHASPYLEAPPLYPQAGS